MEAVWFKLDFYRSLLGYAKYRYPCAREKPFFILIEPLKHNRGHPRKRVAVIYIGLAAESTARPGSPLFQPRRIPAKPASAARHKV